MDRLISEKAVLDTISEWIAHGEYDYTNATEYLRKRIKAIPSAEPKTRRCPNCGIEQFADKFFCPDCGSPMEGE